MLLAVLSDLYFLGCVFILLSHLVFVVPVELVTLMLAMGLRMSVCMYALFSCLLLLLPLPLLLLLLPRYKRGFFLTVLEFDNSYRHGMKYNR